MLAPVSPSYNPEFRSSSPPQLLTQHSSSFFGGALAAVLTHLLLEGNVGKRGLVKLVAPEEQEVDKRGCGAVVWQPLLQLWGSLAQLDWQRGTEGGRREGSL